MAVTAAEEGTPLLNEAEIAARWGSIFFQEFSGRGEGVQPQDLESRLRELRTPWQAQLRPEEWLDEDQLAADACDTLGRMRNGNAMGEDCVPTEYLYAAGPGYLRAFVRLAQRSLQEGVPSRWRTGCMVPVPKKPRVPPECKECWKCVAGVSHRQDLLEDRPDQASGFAPGSCSGPAVQRDQGRFNVGATDRALLFHREDAQGTEMCGSLVCGHQSGLLLHCLCGDCVGWSVATRHEGAAFRQSKVEWPNPTGPP